MASKDVYYPSFFQRYSRDIKEMGVVLLVLAFFWAFRRYPPMQSFVDKGFDPAVAGITVLYGKISSALYRRTGLNGGFVTVPPDPEFVFRVRMATYVNERKAGPLIDLASNQRHPEAWRKDAMLALLKFESVSEWIQPFLNELPKGGLLGLYEADSATLDQLIKRIRAEGGIREPLVRAYGEVVFEFMLQVRDAVVRERALRWISDVLAEQAVFLIATRIPKEEDPKVQKAIEEALWDIRAVSNRQQALEALLPYYKKPPWPTLRPPVAMVLARLGHPSAFSYLDYLLKSVELTEAQRVMVQVARTGTPYPEQLKISPQLRELTAQRKRAREKQLAMALDQRRRALAKARLSSRQARVIERPPLPKAAAPASPAPPAAEPLVEIIATGPGFEEGAIPLKSNPNMSSVDIAFEVKKRPVPLYLNAGADDPTGVVLPLGTRGKANFEVRVGEAKWYQVKTRKGSGWAKGNLLAFVDVTADRAAPERVIEAEVPEFDQQATYFEINSDAAVAYEKPSEKAGEIAVLQEGVAYRAIQSLTVGADRWFFLEVGPGLKGWARGLDLQLANVRR